MNVQSLLNGYEYLVITGASSGIGRTFVGHVLNVNPRLRVFNLSRSVPAPFMINGVELGVCHIPCDLGDREALDLAGQRLLNELERDGAGGRMLLVNNSGFGTYAPFPEPKAAVHDTLLAVNVRAPLMLTALLLPLLRKRGGDVVNIASTAAFQPTPGMATYGASKAFLLHWSLALREELRGSGVHVLAVCPGPTKTNFFRNAGLQTRVLPDSIGGEPGPVVEAALRALARRRGLVVCGWGNSLLAFLCSKLPKVVAAWLAAKVLGHFRPAGSGKACS
jgi:uncharacterized protein